MEPPEEHNDSVMDHFDRAIKQLKDIVAKEKNKNKKSSVTKACDEIVKKWEKYLEEKRNIEINMGNNPKDKRKLQEKLEKLGPKVYYQCASSLCSIVNNGKNNLSSRTYISAACNEFANLKMEGSNGKMKKDPPSPKKKNATQVESTSQTTKKKKENLKGQSTTGAESATQASKQDRILQILNIANITGAIQAFDTMVDIVSWTFNNRVASDDEQKIENWKKFIKKGLKFQKLWKEATKKGPPLTAACLPAVKFFRKIFVEYLRDNTLGLEGHLSVGGGDKKKADREQPLDAIREFYRIYDLIIMGPDVAPRKKRSNAISKTQE